jgi:hypothetical protein
MKYDEEKMLIERQFLRSSTFIDSISFFGGVIFSYALSFLFIYGCVDMPVLVVYLPFVEARLDWLELNETNSVMAYTAAILTAVIVVPLTVLAKWVQYWRTVVRAKEMRPLREGDLKRSIVGVLLVFAGFWVIFFYSPGTDVAGQSGNRFEAVLLWPTFPFIAQCTLSAAATTLFFIPVCFLKLAKSRGSRHD